MENIQGRPQEKEIGTSYVCHIVMPFSRINYVDLGPLNFLFNKILSLELFMHHCNRIGPFVLAFLKR